MHDKFINFATLGPSALALRGINNEVGIECTING